MEKMKTQTERCNALGSSSRMRSRLIRWFALLLLLAMVTPWLHTAAQQPRVIQLIADKDNKFKLPGQKQPVVTAKANEGIKFNVTAHKGTELDEKRPGCVHTFSVKQLKDQGWDVCLKEGMNE